MTFAQQLHRTQYAISIMISFTHYLDRSVCLYELLFYLNKFYGNLLFPLFFTNDNGLMVLYYKITITQETLNKHIIFN